MCCLIDTYSLFCHLVQPFSKIDNLEMPFGIIQTNGEVEPPGTEFLIDDQLATQTIEHSRMKHGTGKVCVF